MPRCFSAVVHAVVWKCQSQLHPSTARPSPSDPFPWDFTAHAGWILASRFGLPVTAPFPQWPLVDSTGCDIDKGGGAVGAGHRPCLGGSCCHKPSAVRTHKGTCFPLASFSNHLCSSLHLAERSLRLWSKWGLLFLPGARVRSLNPHSPSLVNTALPDVCGLGAASTS